MTLRITRREQADLEGGRPGVNWLKDAAERAIKTFLQAFLAQVTASGLGLFQLVEDTSTLQRATLAGVAGAFSLAFSLVSRWVDTPNGSPASVVNTTTPSD